MDEFFSRSEALLGAEVMEALRTKRVIIFGVGGVGSWAAECLIRTGLLHLTIVDGDTVQPSNINRQLPATRETMGVPKVEALKARLLEINPEAEIVAIPEFYHGDNENLNAQIANHQFVIDAIDSVNDKADLILYASRVRGLKIFSSMGAALRFDPTQITTGELMSIKGDALAKAVRARMKRLDWHPNKRIRCVYSEEQAQRCETRGSLMQVTGVFGLTLASLVIEGLKS
ncbi:MAG: tRNA threonylcarbamoyladenosine dehydratase [Paludibacteraceae bacterium]|nr:tRNA threonylcarbamoyladenosine dehydratase [Paludibacteraceae bacterium]